MTDAVSQSHDLLAHIIVFLTVVWVSLLIGAGIYLYLHHSLAMVKTPLSQYFIIAIAYCVTVGGYAIGSIPFGSLNLAVSVGISSAMTLNGARPYREYPEAWPTPATHAI